MLSWLFVTTKSGLPSPFRSAATTDVGKPPVSDVVCDWKVPAAVAEQHAHGALHNHLVLHTQFAFVRDSEVGVAVPVQVQRHDRHGLVAYVVRLLKLEGTVAVAEQHAPRVPSARCPFATTRSGLPSWFRVHRHDRRGVRRHVGYVFWRLARYSSPLPSSTLTVPVGGAVRDDEVGLAVVVQVHRHDRRGMVRAGRQWYVF